MQVAETPGSAATTSPVNHMIGGREVPSKSGRTFPSIDPATGRRSPRSPSATPRMSMRPCGREGGVRVGRLGGASPRASEPGSCAVLPT